MHRRTVRQLSDELSIEDRLHLDLASEVELPVGLALLRSRLAEAICLSPARLVPLLADLAERRRVELDVGLRKKRASTQETIAPRARVSYL